MFLGLTTANWIDLLLALGGAAFLGKVWGKLKILVRGVQFVINEVSPNGGKSTKDKLIKLVEITEEQNKTLEGQNKVLKSHTDQLAELRGEITTRNEFKEKIVEEIRDAIHSSHEKKPH